MFTTTRGRRARGADQRGSAAVEFALVVPILISLVFGIIDYGLWFSESLNVRQGVREAVRAGVVQNFAQPGCSGSNMDQLVCKVRAQIRPTAGTAYARVVVPPAGWVRGEQLLVCGMVKTQGVSGLMPLPADGLVKSATSMSIERETSTSPAAAGTYGDAAPSGGSWSWCS